MDNGPPKDSLPKEKGDARQDYEERVNNTGVQMVSSLTGEISYDDVDGTPIVSDLTYSPVGEPDAPTQSNNPRLQTGGTYPLPQQPLNASQSPGAVRVRGIDWHESIDYDDEAQNDNDNSSSSTTTSTDETNLSDIIEPVASAMPIEDSFVAIATELTDEDSILDGRTNDSKFGIVPFRSNSVRLYVAIAMGIILSLAIVAGVMAGIKSGDNGSQTSPAPSTNIPTSTPTPVQTSTPPTSTNPSQSPLMSTLPTVIPLVRAEMITNLTVTISGDKVHQNGTAQQKALSWILDEDPQHLSASDPRLLQRYVASLLYFQLDGENWMDNTGYLTGANECDWFGMVCGEWSQLKWAIESISLMHNFLRGEIPREISQLPKVRVLDLYENKLYGTIPTEIGEMNLLHILNLFENELRGEIPPTISNLPNLRRLKLGSNLLTGTIPSTIGQMENIITISFSDNKLTGTIPPELSNLTRLDYLSLRENLLTGTIPSLLGNLLLLVDLRLCDNKLNGTIPSDLGNLENLTNLQLHENHLAGSVPQSVCELRQGQLDELEVDCDEVNCSCCTNCDKIRYER